MIGKLTIATPSAAWHAAERVRARHRWLMEVCSALRDGSTDYLPREASERSVGGVDPYAIRAARSLLSPDFAMGIWDHVGRVLGEEFKRDLGGDEELEALYGDIDDGGRDLQVFLQAVFADLWLQGEPFVLVENAPGGGNPFWVLFESEQNLRVKWGLNSKGARVPKRIHIDNPRAGGLWDSEMLPRTRVLLGDGEPSVDPATEGAGPGASLGNRGARWEFWRQNDQKEWVPSREEDEQPGRYVEDEIPGFLFQFGRKHKKTGAVIPPSEWLSEVCLHQYRESSDHGTMIRILRACLLFFKGMDFKTFTETSGNTLHVGPYAIIFGGTGDAQLMTVETSGTSPDLSFRELERIEAMVRLAALAPVDPGRAQTLGAKVIDVRLSSATLRASAVQLRDGTEELMRITAARMGKSEPGTLHIPTEFTLTASEVNEIQVITDLLKQDHLSWRTAMEKLKLGVRKLEDVDLDDEEVLLEKERAERDKRGAERVKRFAGGNPIGESE